MEYDNMGGPPKHFELGSRCADGLHMVGGVAPFITVFDIAHVVTNLPGAIEAVAMFDHTARVALNDI